MSEQQVQQLALCVIPRQQIEVAQKKNARGAHFHQDVEAQSRI
jgi:hypothetical protein